MGLTLLAPVVYLAVALIKLDTPGPAVFRQPRRGLNGRVFWMFNFRTVQAIESEDDPTEVTAVGSVLRKLKIDGIP